MKNITQIRFAHKNNRYNTSLKLGKHDTAAWDRKRYEEEQETNRSGYDYEDYDMDGFKKMRQTEMSSGEGEGNKKEDTKVGDQKDPKSPYPKYNPNDKEVKRSDYFE